MLRKLFDRLRSVLLNEELVQFSDYWVPQITYPTPEPERQVIKVPAPPEPTRAFTVYVDDNYHFMDEYSRYKAGEFDTYEEALALARKIVDESIVSPIETGSTPERVLEQYRMFGEDPFILSNGTIEYDGHFSAWSYAEERARTLYEAKQWMDRHIKETPPSTPDMKAVPPAPDNTNTDIGDTHE